MSRLFVAASLPDELIAALHAVQPAHSVDVRLSLPEQMHLTVHFLGEAPVRPVTEALSALSVAPVPLVVEGVGQFRAHDGTVTLWAGFRASPELLALHAAVAEALAPTGFRPEARPYVPHITLARCKPTVAPEVVERFLRCGEGLAYVGARITAIALFSSEVARGVPIYTERGTFPLIR